MTDAPQTFPERPLTKEEFLQRWSLVRAPSMAMMKGRVYIGDMMNEALAMWKEIQKEKSK